jgi:diacylglycerol kinase (ATP)
MTGGHASHSAGDWVAIQRNRRSGAGGQYRAVTDLIRELRRLGITPRLYSSRELLDRDIELHGRDRLRGIVAAGGDGTILDLIHRHPNLPIAPLPLGTENLVAKHFGIPRRDGRFVARMIAAGRTKRIDLGRVGDRRFCIMVSCGFDAEVIHRAHAARSGHITRLHYLRPILATLMKRSLPVVRVYLDGQPDPVEGTLAVVANMARYALGLDVAATAEPSDGLLHVRIFDHRSLFQILRDFTNVWLGRQERVDTVFRATARRVRLVSDGIVPVQSDGDPCGTLPTEVTIEPLAATLIVP